MHAADIPGHTARPITPIAVTIFPLAAAQKTWLAKFTADISIDVD
jgi:hypothetical protein